MKSEKYSSHPLPGDTAEMISLWQTTFQDSNEFVDLYFSRVYKPENTLVIKNDGKIVSALQMIPYEIKIADKIIPSAYVAGVCTLTHERGKGLMSILMSEAMDYMRQKGYGITTLIPAYPWLFDIYKKFGYICPINYSLECYFNESGSDKRYLSQETTTSDYTFTLYSNKYFSYFDKKQRERQCVLLHNEYDVENILCDLTNENGNVWVALCGETPVGISFAYPISEKDIIIKEILYDSLQVKKSLIYHALSAYNARTAKVFAHEFVNTETNNTETNNSTNPPDLKKTYPYGLACILDKQIVINDLYMTLMLD